MKRSWLIGAALVFSLSAVACSDDDEDGPDTAGDSGIRGDAGNPIDAGGGLDGSIDSSIPSADAGDAGDAN